MFTATEIQDLDTIIDGCLQKGHPIFATHAFKNNGRELIKNLLPVCPKRKREGKGEEEQKRTMMAIAKLFALHANAVM